jgi:hypothetical protein
VEINTNEDKIKWISLVYFWTLNNKNVIEKFQYFRYQVEDRDPNLYSFFFNNHSRIMNEVKKLKLNNKLKKVKHESFK